MSVAQWAERIAIPLGERGAGPLAWRLGRIDVADVSVNDGAQIVRGTYQVFASDATGRPSRTAFLRCHPETNTGVDVPPGRYRVEISYSTVEAGKKVTVFTVVVPP